MYIQFLKVEDIEKYYCHSIHHKDYGEMTVVGCVNKIDDSIDVYCVDKDGNENCINSKDLLVNATFRNHPFGLKIGEEDEDF